MAMSHPFSPVERFGPHLLNTNRGIQRSGNGNAAGIRTECKETNFPCMGVSKSMGVPNPSYSGGLDHPFGLRHPFKGKIFKGGSMIGKAHSWKPELCLSIFFSGSSQAINHTTPIAA